EIGLDDRAQLPSLWGRLRRRDHPVPRLLKGLPNGLNVKILFAFEVAIETTMRQTKVLHQAGDTFALRAALTKRLRGGADNLLVRRGLLFSGISHEDAIRLRS